MSAHGKTEGIPGDGYRCSSTGETSTWRRKTKNRMYVEDRDDQDGGTAGQREEGGSLITVEAFLYQAVQF